jgi:lipoyl(octanoyl) transferase
MIQSLYLGRVDYAEGLSLQAEIAALVAEGRLANVLLLLEHPPVLTLGRHANRANVLASDEMLALRGVTLHQINRGGDVTYHGPGQLVGYPLFDLRSLKGPSGGGMGPVDFVRGMEEALIRLCAGYGVCAGRIAGLTGVWCGKTGNREQGIGNRSALEENAAPHSDSAGRERKIAAIGIHVAKGITSHGFAFNLTTNLRDFELIVPCGIPDHAVTSLELELAFAPARPAELPALETVAHQAAGLFGLVLDQQVLAVDSLADLRAQAAASGPVYPAEDTPLQVPAELERLRSAAEPTVRA